MTLGEHLTMAASAKMFYIAIDYKNKTYLEEAASNINIKNTSAIFWTADFWCPHDHCTAKNLMGLDTNLVLITCKPHLWQYS